LSACKSQTNFDTTINRQQRAARSVRNGTDGRDRLVAMWPMLAGGKTRAVVMPSSDGHGAFASAVLGKGLPFYGCCGAATVI
jgi:hypothetical protein